MRSEPAPTPITPPIESMLVAICSAVLVVVPWSSSDGRERGGPRLGRRILRGSGADDETQADRRLFVVRRPRSPGDHSASVLKAYGGNFTSRAASGRGGRSDGQFGTWATAGDATASRAAANTPGRRRAHRPPPPLPDPLGMIVRTSRFSGVKYFWATR